MNKKLYLFDIDGTLLASGGAGMAALREMARELFGRDNLDGIEVAGRTDSLIARELLAREGKEATPEAITTIIDCYLTHLTRLLPLTQGTLLPGIIELLDTLKARPDCVLALLTGNVSRGAELKLTHYKVWDYFEFGAFADDHHDRNELGVFARARARERHGIEFPPESIYVLGDTPHDVTCARAIGAKAVAIATGGYAREQLAACTPDFLFDDLSNVPEVIAAIT
jgi:phosphoglycolate phosphatase